MIDVGRMLGSHRAFQSSGFVISRVGQHKRRTRSTTGTGMTVKMRRWDFIEANERLVSRNSSLYFIHDLTVRSELVHVLLYFA